MGTMPTPKIFKPAARYPADPRAVFILTLSVFSGLTALALDAAPQSLDSALPEWGVFVWGAILTLGSLTTVVGMAFQSPNGIITEQIGSVMVGAATTFYGVLALAVVGPDALQGIGIVLAWGLACFIRWAQLQALINNSVARAEQIEYMRSIFEKIEEVEGTDARRRAERNARRDGVI